jgi:hypothetical protein
MSKNITQVINPPKLMITLSLSNDEFQYLTDLVSVDFSSINNGVFVKNNSSGSGQIVSVKIANVTNVANTIELINDDNIFIELDTISNLQLKGDSTTPRSVSIFVN